MKDILLTGMALFGSNIPSSIQNLALDKEALQNHCLEQMTIDGRQGMSENKDFEEKPTPSQSQVLNAVGYNTENEPFSTLENEYTPKYCLQLEAAYGQGLMSDGGEEAIDWMFDQVPLEGKVALDIGSGMGGVAFYLAEKYHMHITGLEINPWLVMESAKRVPEHLKQNVTFLLSTGNSNWPFAPKSYDIVYSKGVLTHVEKKDSLFQECHKLLKENGLFVITDWLSSEKRVWGNYLAKLVELEHLTLFPESESGYIEIFKRNGFELLSVRDDTPVYLEYNRQIIERLRNLANEPLPPDIFSKSELEESIVGYESIVNAFEIGELRVLRFIAQPLNKNS
jgi:cyclopropane fatty-acyl-phospholipid synthase-like methyltransferase